MPAALSATVRALPAARAAPRRGSVVVQATAQPSPPGQPGDRLLPLLRSPVDLLALGPRVALGALTDISAVLEKIPSDVERLSMLAQDPRPLDQKQAEVLQELESRVVAYMERGSTVEAGVITTVAAAIPQPIKDALPAELREALLNPRPVGSDANGNGAYYSTYPSSSSSSSNGDTPLWTLTSDEEGQITMPPAARPSNGSTPAGSASAAAMADEPPMTPQQLAARQTAAEVSEVQAAVQAVRQQLEALRSNTDASRVNMMRLNLREARQALSRALEEIRPAARVGSSAEPTLAAAVAEAELLLAEVAAAEGMAPFSP